MRGVILRGIHRVLRDFSKCVFSYRPKARADLRPRGRWPSIRVDGPGDRSSVPRRSGLSGKPRVCDDPCGLPDPAAWVQSSRGRHASPEPDSNLVLEEVRPPDLILPSSRGGGAHRPRSEGGPRVGLCTRQLRGVCVTFGLLRSPGFVLDPRQHHPAARHRRQCIGRLRNNPSSLVRTEQQTPARRRGALESAACQLRGAGLSGVPDVPEPLPCEHLLQETECRSHGDLDPTRIP